GVQTCALPISEIAKKRIQIVGRVSEEKKIELLLKSDIFILQSDNEGMPISILEAMASGCAIITTPVGTITEVVKDNINGIIINPKSESQLAGAICKLHLDKKLLHTIQFQNRLDIVKYSWENQSEKIASFYSLIMGERFD